MRNVSRRKLQSRLPGKIKGGFHCQMGIVEEEADECLYWLELLVGAGIATLDKALPLMDEANQLLSITVSSVKTARKSKSCVER